MRLLSLTLVTTVLFLGCGRNNMSEEVNVWSDSITDERIEHIQGDWKFVSQKIDSPQVTSQILDGPNIIIRGHIIRYEHDVMPQELRLCNIWIQSDLILANGWHHEDVDDPGDMSRRECELRVNDNQLEIRQRVIPDAMFSEDPIFASQQPPAVESKGLWSISTYARAE